MGTTENDYIFHDFWYESFSLNKKQIAPYLNMMGLYTYNLKMRKKWISNGFEVELHIS